MGIVNLSYMNSSVNGSALGVRLRYFSHRVFNYLAFRIVLAGQQYQQNAQAIQNLQYDLSVDAIHRSGYLDHYDEMHEQLTWQKYEKEFREKDVATSDAIFRASYVSGYLSELLWKDQTVQNIVNFGCAYGWLEHELADKYPTINAWGIDRSQVCIERNKQTFNRPNCRFVAYQNIFDFIHNNPFAMADSVFCHVNTGTYFMPRFLRQLYLAALDAGAKYILIWEPAGASRQDHRHMEYSMNPRPSKVFRGPMLLHNYPGILNECGFDTITAELHHPPHPDQDFRSVLFIGQRKEG